MSMIETLAVGKLCYYVRQNSYSRFKKGELLTAQCSVEGTRYRSKDQKVINQTREKKQPKRSRLVLQARVAEVLFFPTASFGERSFSFCAPKIWNSLPFDIRHKPSAASFKSALKTYLFRRYYS